MIVDELHKLGAAHAYMQADSEMDAVRKALQWARPADFLVLLLHAERKAAMNLLQSLADAGWQAGDPLP